MRDVPHCDGEVPAAEGVDATAEQAPEDGNRVASTRRP